jgi:hypothetical protein
MNRYGAKVSGQTGTIGSRKSQDIFSNIYIFDLFIMPRFKARKFEEKPPSIVIKS